MTLARMNKTVKIVVGADAETWHCSWAEKMEDFSHGHWAGPSKTETSTARNHIIEASGVLSKGGSYRDVHCARLHAGIYDRCIIYVYITDGYINYQLV